MKSLKKFFVVFSLLGLCISGCSVLQSNDYKDDKRYEIYQLAVADGFEGTYEQWLASIKGEKGDTGAQGEPGKDGEDGHTPVITIGNDGFWYIDGVNTHVKAQGQDGVQGPKGDKGDTGETGPQGPAGQNGTNGQDGVAGAQGPQGEQGPAGQNGKDGISVVSITKTSSNDLTDTYTIAYSNGTTSTFTVTNGQNGATGAQGEQGEQGIQGNPGADGHTPVITISEKGYWVVDGVETSTLAQGPKGDAGAQGDKGDNGESAYQIYVKAHPEYTGTEEEWLDDLVNGRLGIKDRYTVSFDSNGGSFVEPQKVECGKKATKPANPTKDGYDFIDWVDENNDHWVFNGYGITSDITLYALWAASHYTISLNPNGGSVDNPTIEVTYLDSFVLPIPTRNDYYFDGWYLGDELITSSSYVYNHDISIIAKWSKDYTVSFDSNGGSEVNDIVTHSDTISELPIPTKDDYVFDGWYLNGEQIELPYSNSNFNDLHLVAKWKLITSDYELLDNGDGTLTISKYTGNDQVINIPTSLAGSTITGIGEEAFINNDVIKMVRFSDSIVSVGDSAFENCTSLESISFNFSLPSSGYGNKVLLGCTSLKQMAIPSVDFRITKLFNKVNSNIQSNVPNNLEITLLSIDSNIRTAFLKDFTKPLSITISNSITSIPASAFSDCTSLTSITIPDSITSIGGYAFRDCSGLTSITIPESVTSIGDGAFYGCSNLTSVTIPDSITSIGYCAFYGCSNLTSITIPESVTSIGGNAFYGCSGLTSITIPESVTSIGAAVFYGCSNLTSITIPESVTSIDHDAFNSCSSLASITIPDSVASIGDATFSGCTSLTSITIPDSVTSIGGYAFQNCSSLTTISFKGKKEDWGKIVFDAYWRTNSSIVTIICSDGTISL